jgi:hypothetical protein
MSRSLTSVTTEVARYKLDLVDVQEVKWDKGITVSAGDYIFSEKKKTKIINWVVSLYTIACFSLFIICFSLLFSNYSTYVFNIFYVYFSILFFI